MSTSSTNDEGYDSSDPSLAEYRSSLVALEQKSQESFDKTVLSLSGGALGISFVFLKDIIGPSPVVNPTLLLTAWGAWATSSIAVLLSFFISHLAIRKAIKQFDEGEIYNAKPGGWMSSVTAILNVTGALAFFIGVILITLFAGSNLTDQEDSHGEWKENGQTQQRSEPHT